MKIETFKRLITLLFIDPFVLRTIFYMIITLTQTFENDIDVQRASK